MKILEYNKYTGWRQMQNDFKTANEALQDALMAVDSIESDKLSAQLSIYKDGEFAGYKTLPEEDAAFEYGRLYGSERKIILEEKK